VKYFDETFTENTNFEIKIADFGQSRNIENTDKTLESTVHAKGTPKYAAPETFYCKYSEKSDIYSFGIILSEIISGKKPYHDMDIKSNYLFQKSVSDGKRPTFDRSMYNEEYFGDLQTWFEKFTDHEPKKRPNIKEFAEFIQKQHEKMVDSKKNSSKKPTDASTPKKRGKLTANNSSSPVVSSNTESFELKISGSPVLNNDSNPLVTPTNRPESPIVKGVPKRRKSLGQPIPFEEKQKLIQKDEQIKNLEEDENVESKEMKRIEDERKTIEEKRKQFEEEAKMIESQLEERKLKEAKLLSDEKELEELIFNSTFSNFVQDSKNDEKKKIVLVSLIESYGLSENTSEATVALESLLKEENEENTLLIEKLKSFMKEEISKSKFCTSEFNSQFLLQKSYKCETCSAKNDKLISICGLCAKNCHQGHEIHSDENLYRWMYCDCVRFIIKLLVEFSS
jgi:hypothetical protein